MLKQLPGSQARKRRPSKIKDLTYALRMTKVQKKFQVASAVLKEPGFFVVFAVIYPLAGNKVCQPPGL